ncbi:MAG: hypothetical protein U0U67_17060 [Chitinophagales bacterium]
MEISLIASILELYATLMRTLIILSQIFFWIFLISCNNQNNLPSREKYPNFYKNTYDYDTSRIRLGLPTIANNLEFESYNFCCFTIPPTDCGYFISKDTFTIPRYSHKIVFWDSIGVYIERNYFLGPNQQNLRIYYSYRKVEGLDYLGYNCFLFDINNDKSTTLNKSQADSILRQWNIKY